MPGYHVSPLYNTSRFRATLLTACHRCVCRYYGAKAAASTTTAMVRISPLTYMPLSVRCAGSVLGVSYREKLCVHVKPLPHDTPRVYTWRVYTYNGVAYALCVPSTLGRRRGATAVSVLVPSSGFGVW